MTNPDTFPFLRLPPPKTFSRKKRLAHPPPPPERIPEQHAKKLQAGIEKIKKHVETAKKIPQLVNRWRVNPKQNTSTRPTLRTTQLGFPF